MHNWKLITENAYLWKACFKDKMCKKRNAIKKIWSRKKERKKYILSPEKQQKTISMHKV